jgi:hypothetical protein
MIVDSFSNSTGLGNSPRRARRGGDRAGELAKEAFHEATVEPRD